MTEPERAGTRFNYHLVVTVTDPADGLGLEPIAPTVLSRAVPVLLGRLLEHGGSQASVGAMSVTCQQAPDTDALDALDATEAPLPYDPGNISPADLLPQYQYRAPGPANSGSAVGTWTAAAFTTGELEPRCTCNPSATNVHAEWCAASSQREPHEMGPERGVDIHGGRWTRALVAQAPLPGQDGSGWDLLSVFCWRRVPDPLPPGMTAADYQVHVVVEWENEQHVFTADQADWLALELPGILRKAAATVRSIPPEPEP